MIHRLRMASMSGRTLARVIAAALLLGACAPQPPAARPRSGAPVTGPVQVAGKSRAYRPGLPIGACSAVARRVAAWTVAVRLSDRSPRRPLGSLPARSGVGSPGRRVSVPAVRRASRVGGPGCSCPSRSRYKTQRDRCRPVRAIHPARQPDHHPARARIAASSVSPAPSMPGAARSGPTLRRAGRAGIVHW